MDDRKALSAAVGSVVWNAANHPNPTAVWGRDISPLREKVVDAVLASDWLAAHDREVEAKALEAFASNLRDWAALHAGPEGSYAARVVIKKARTRAATIRSTQAADPEPTETNGEQR